jgi:predicted ATPase
MHLHGIAAPESKAAVEKARLLVERAEVLEEPPDEPLLFSALTALYSPNIAAINGDAGSETAAQDLALAEKLGDKVTCRRRHCSIGVTLMITGNFVESLLHFDKALALYDPVDQWRPETRFAEDHQAVTSLYRSLVLWALGYPDIALADTGIALSYARETSRAASLMRAMSLACLFQVISGNYAIAKAQSDEMILVAEEVVPEEEGSNYWTTSGMLRRAWFLALTGKTSDAVGIFTSAIDEWRSVGITTLSLAVWLSHLARACGKIGRFDDALSHIGEAITVVETSNETWYEAEVNRVGGEIALMSPERDAAKAEAYFERALVVARKQQAKSFELRAAMSLARLWRDQGKRDEARDLLAPIYGWFTEGFDTLDLKQAKALLDELAQ